MGLVQLRAVSSVERGPRVRWLTAEVCASGSDRSVRWWKTGLVLTLERDGAQF